MPAARREGACGMGLDDPEITFGGPETVGSHVEQFVVSPRVFLVAPERELPLQHRVVPDVMYRRYEKWYDEDGRPMGRWTWVTLEAMIREKDRREEV